MLILCGSTQSQIDEEVQGKIQKLKTAIQRARSINKLKTGIIKI